MKRIKPGSKADHARMKSSYSKAAKKAQNALREQLDLWVSLASLPFFMPIAFYAFSRLSKF